LRWNPGKALFALPGRLVQSEGTLPEFWKGLGALRVGAMAGVAAALTGFFLYIFGMIAEAPMAILYSGLEPREAGAVAAKLDAINVPYEQRGDGGTILIPADQVSRIRMQLATEGLPSAGVGYEIFDKTDTFGTSTFVQNVNRLRALEGELARTIRSIDSIESARVHLVIPERQVFAQANQTPSASVVLKTRTRLGNGQVSAVQHLVASAVAGLAPNDVAIIDERGELLAGRNGDTENDIALAQEDRASAFEERMRQRVENIVASVVGPGRTRVQVAAEMDFNRVTETSESFDPDSRVIRLLADGRAELVRAGGADRSCGERRHGLAGQRPTRPDRHRTELGQHAQRGNHQLRDLEEHQDARAGCRNGQEALGRGRGRRHLHHGRQRHPHLCAAQRSGHDEHHRVGEVGRRLQ
jgi:type III secretory pathway lipoprotein EscJ